MVLLTDKYKPTDLSQLIGNKESLTTLNLALSSSSHPHLLLYGPPGTGKSTCAKILASSSHLLELNASNERGIDIIRNKVKNFTQKKIKERKTVILDECDSMTTTAQQGLRRIMETCTDTCFILVCNNISKIYEAIQSRCGIIRFDKIEDDLIKKRIYEILKIEKVECDESVVDMIVYMCEGDMRQMLNVMSVVVGRKVLCGDQLSKIIGVPPPKVVHNIVQQLMNNNKDGAVTLFESMWKQKYDPVDIISSFFRIAKYLDNYELLKHIGMCHIRINEGCNSKLQFYKMFHEITEMCER